MKEIQDHYSIWEQDCNYFEQGLVIAGVDEAGRGSLSGPVVAAAYIHDPAKPFLPVKDSKMLTPLERKRLYNDLMDTAASFSVGLVEAAEIDRINILQATLKAMNRAIKSLTIKPEIILIDGNKMPVNNYQQKAIIKGDQKIGSIAAASIIAKVTRDAIMEKLHDHWPQYCFDKNKGYGTFEHRRVLQAMGPSPIHRRSFGTIKQPQLSIYQERENA